MLCKKKLFQLQVMSHFYGTCFLCCRDAPKCTDCTSREYLQLKFSLKYMWMRIWFSFRFFFNSSISWYWWLMFAVWTMNFGKTVSISFTMSSTVHWITYFFVICTTISIPLLFLRFSFLVIPLSIWRLFFYIHTFFVDNDSSLFSYKNWFT